MVVATDDIIYDHAEIRFKSKEEFGDKHLEKALEKLMGGEELSTEDWEKIFHYLNHRVHMITNEGPVDDNAVVYIVEKEWKKPRDPGTILRETISNYRGRDLLEKLYGACAHFSRKPLSYTVEEGGAEKFLRLIIREIARQLSIVGEMPPVRYDVCTQIKPYLGLQLEDKAIGPIQPFTWESSIESRDEKIEISARGLGIAIISSPGPDELKLVNYRSSFDLYRGKEEIYLPFSVGLFIPKKIATTDYVALKVIKEFYEQLSKEDKDFRQLMIRLISTVRAGRDIYDEW